MELIVGIILIVALFVGFMVLNYISERKTYEDVRKKLGEKIPKKKK